MSRRAEFDTAHSTYRAARDAHGRTFTGDGCRCGYKASGLALHKHISEAVTTASRSHLDAVTRRR